jgi:cell division transport system permease protein
MGYLLRETGRSIWRNKGSSFLSAIATGLALFLLGTSYLLNANIGYMFQSVEQQLEIQVYLDKEISQAHTSLVMEYIREIPEVIQLQYVSKEDALEELYEVFKDKPSILQGLNYENPLPASIRIRVDEVSVISEIVPDLRKLEGVDEVTYQEEVSKRLEMLSRVVHIASLASVAVVGFVALVLISNSIRLTIHARRHEISIMKLVGATDMFITGPFLLEGIVLGIVGSVMGAAMTIGLYMWLFQSVRMALPFVYLLNIDYTLARDMLVIMLITGTGVGITGSVFSMRRHLRV